MHACQILFLAATISSASIVLADILVQPGYEHQYRSNQHNLYHQPVLQYNQMPFPDEQHHAKQLTQQSMQHLTGVHTYPYYRMYHNPTPLLNSMRFPISHHSHYPAYLPKPAGHLHYVKVGGHGHARPPMFVGYPYPLTVHHQYRRSCKSDPTETESSESATTEYEDDVAPKPSLVNVEHSTVNDSLLPENEPTDTEKRVENRESKNDRTRPFLFGLNPERMYPKYRQIENLNATKQSLFKPVSATSNTLKTLNEQSAINVQSIEPTQILSTTPQKREQDQETIYLKQEDRRIRKMFSKDLGNSSIPTQTSSDKESSDEELLSAEPESVMIIKIPCVNYNQSHMSFVVEFNVADLEEIGPDTSTTDTRQNEALSGSDEIIDSPNLNTISVPSATQTFYSPTQTVLSNNDVAPFATYYDYDYYNDYYKDYDYPHSTNPDYVIYKNTYTQDNPASTMDTGTLLDVSRMQQFSDTYNYPTKTRYVPLPKVRKYYYVTPDTTYSHVPLYRTFSSPVYY